MSKWDEVKYSTFTFTIDDPNSPDSYERIKGHAKKIMGLAAVSILFWLLTAAGDFLLTGAEIIINIFLLYAAYTGYTGARDTINGKILLYWRFLAGGTALSLFALYAIVHKFMTAYEANCDQLKGDCPTGLFYFKMLFISLLNSISIVYCGFAIYIAWKHTREE